MIFQSMVMCLDVAKAYQQNDTIAKFVRYLAIFITSFLKAHLNLLEAADDNTKSVPLTRFIAFSCLFCFCRCNSRIFVCRSLRLIIGKR